MESIITLQQKIIIAPKIDLALTAIAASSAYIPQFSARLHIYVEQSAAEISFHFDYHSAGLANNSVLTFWLPKSCRNGWALLIPIPNHVKLHKKKIHKFSISLPQFASNGSSFKVFLALIRN